MKTQDEPNGILRQLLSGDLPTEVTMQRGKELGRLEVAYNVRP
jgi:hypothetical protein